MRKLNFDRLTNCWYRVLKVRDSHQPIDLSSLPSLLVVRATVAGCGQLDASCVGPWIGGPLEFQVRNVCLKAAIAVASSGSSNSTNKDSFSAWGCPAPWQ